MPSVSSERHTQSLRNVHERLVAFISAHASLGQATLGLADSIVEFYSPEVNKARGGIRNERHSSTDSSEQCRNGTRQRGKAPCTPN